jgi:replicative DNA helicase
MIENTLRPKEMVTTGITTLDYLMQGGLQQTRMYGIGGVFGRGKTVLLGSISDNLNLSGIPHLFLSLETPPEDIEARHAARHMNINASCLMDSTDTEYDRFVSKAQEYQDRVPDKVRYDYAPGATIGDIHRKILAAKARHGCRGVIIDYWQLITGRERGQNQDQHLANVANRLAAIARQEGIWIVIAAQVDERGRLIDSNSLLRAASLFVRIERDVNGPDLHFTTEKSNYTPYADTGSESVPGMIFDQEVGPYFRNTEEADIGDLNREGSIKI